MNHRPRRQAALNTERAFAANRDNDNQLQTDSRLDGWNSTSIINDLFTNGVQCQASMIYLQMEFNVKHQ